MPRHSRAVAVWAALYGLALAMIGLWPTHVDENLDVVGLPPVRWLLDLVGMSQPTGYAAIELVANIVLFIPLGIFLLVMWPHLGFIRSVALGVLTSAVIEVLQEVVRPGRSASFRDAVANTAGAALGAGVVWLWGRRREDG